MTEAPVTTQPNRFRAKRVLLLGATGTIGRATARALVQRGHDVVCLVRPRAGVGGALTSEGIAKLLDGTTVRFGDVTDASSLVRDVFSNQRFDALVSCLASRTGASRDAWNVDYKANKHALSAAGEHGIKQFVLLSAICVQKPLLAFQQAKLAFEKELIASGLTYTIVRPTAFFKSLSGQVDRVKQGKPFVVFGDGKLTACKPISDDDLACFLVDCLDDENRRDRVLPIGGPGNAITPKEQGEHLFKLLGREPRFRHIPLQMLDAIALGLKGLGYVVPPLAGKAEFARIARYYATESMLVLDPVTRCYDSSATPSTGTETLFDHYKRLISGNSVVERGDHALF